MIEKIINKIKSEPVRVRLYSVLIAVAAYAVVKGYVSATDLEFVATVAALVLGVERSRAHVAPVPAGKRKRKRQTA